MSVPAFYQWKRPLAAEVAGAAGTPALLPIRVTSSAPPAVEPALPGGAVLRFGPGTGPARTAAVVRRFGVTGCGPSRPA